MSEAQVHESGRFKDRFGREWDATLTLSSAKRIDASDYTELWPGEVSMLEPSRELFNELLKNRPLAVAIVYTILKPQADKADIDQDAFLDAIDGRTLADLIDVLWDTLADFFPQAKTALSELQSLQKMAQEKAQAGLARMGERARTELDKAINEALTKAEQELESGLTGETSTQPSVA